MSIPSRHHTSHLSYRADMQRYESVMSWKAHDGEVYSVEFSYDENTVFSIGEDGKVSLCVLNLLKGFIS